MGDKVGPVGPVQRRDERREAERRSAERRAAATSRALVTLEPSVDNPAEPPARAAPPATSDPSASAFAAQVMGQTGQRRGLKGGPPVLDAARSTYLGNAYSGGAERRPRPGKASDTDV